MSTNARELVTPPVRLAFPALFKPKPRFQGSDRETYQAVLLLPPDTDMAPFVAAMKAAMVEKFGKVIQLPAAKNPIRDCGDKTIDGYEDGWAYINTHSGYAPAVVDQQRQEIIDPSKIYAGCWCRFHLTAYAWDHPSGGKGVSFSVNAVQLVRDGERLDGRRDVSEIFESITVEGDEESSASAGAEELFG